MRIPKKRELAALWLLYRRDRVINLGEAIDILRNEMCLTKRTALNIIKRLKKIGALEIKVSESDIKVEVKDPLSLFKAIAEEYLLKRRKRCRRPRRSRDEEGRTL